MDGESWLVGSVAFGIGTLAWFAAISNHDAFFQLPKLQWIERHGGRRGARLFCAVLGIVFQGLGIAIILGYRWKSP